MKIIRNEIDDNDVLHCSDKINLSCPIQYISNKYLPQGLADVSHCIIIFILIEIRLLCFLCINIFANKRKCNAISCYDNFLHLMDCNTAFHNIKIIIEAIFCK